MNETIDHLRRVDPRLGAVIDQVGACALRGANYRTTFEALARSIAYQQLSGHAAATIYRRFVEGFGNGRQPSARRVSVASVEALRDTGLSRAKAEYIRDLACAHCKRALPSRAALEAMSDAQIVAALIGLRGVGLWTVQMLLIFWLKRPDVLPADDLGIRKGLKIAHRMRALPAPSKVLKVGRRWAPYRSVASWYLWRASEF